MKRGISGTCKWCGRDDVRRPAFYWHKECAQQYLLHTRPEEQRKHLLARDGRQCAQCGAVPKKWLSSQVERITFLDAGWRIDKEMADSLWPQPEGRWDELDHQQRHTGDQQRIDRVCALEVDHKVPLWSVAHLPPDERRPYFGPSNLWLLCPACHKAKSRQEAAERAAVRRAA